MENYQSVDSLPGSYSFQGHFFHVKLLNNQRIPGIPGYLVSEKPCSTGTSMNCSQPYPFILSGQMEHISLIWIKASHGDDFPQINHDSKVQENRLRSMKFTQILCQGFSERSDPHCNADISPRDTTPRGHLALFLSPVLSRCSPVLKRQCGQKVSLGWGKILGWHGLSMKNRSLTLKHRGFTSVYQQNMGVNALNDTHHSCLMDSFQGKSRVVQLFN